MFERTCLQQETKHKDHCGFQRFMGLRVSLPSGNTKNILFSVFFIFFSFDCVVPKKIEHARSCQCFSFEDANSSGDLPITSDI